MNKTVKKLDNNVVRALNVLCEQAKTNIPGFEWLTHTADYSNFPASLVVTCVFDTRLSLANAKQNQRDAALTKQMQKELLKVGILLKNAKANISFDSEEAGAKDRLL